MSSEEEEVADDYRVALEELSMNNRTEIVNLTSIARDYTAHALKIAEVLQQHIIKTAPNKKLPALYVLDSIVKNVGTPYTLYFGRNLFKTFMEAYAVAGPDVRRRMEEMLKTWTQPVPGSLDTRPVFNPELVRPIENALMKFKQATMPQGQMAGRPRSAIGGQARDTPTPPGGRGFGRPPAGQQLPNGHAGAYAMHPGNPQQQPSYYGNSTPQPPNAAHRYQSPTPVAHGSQSSGLSNESLSKDIANLILAMKAELAQNPNDASIHTRLKALGDLQGIMQAAALPHDQLELIKNKVTELAAVTMRALSATPNNVPAQYARPASQPPPVAAPVAPPPAQGQMSLDSLLGPGALAALMARGSSATPQNSTPQPPPALPQAAIRSPQPPAVQPYQQPASAPPAAPSNPMGLLDQLRKAGLLGTPVNAAPAAAPPPPPPQQPVIPASIAQLLASRIGNTPVTHAGPVAPGMIDVAALKQSFRPDLISQLYEQLGPPCNQCGRRFKTDEDGRKKKAKHMDWHFRVAQRSNEAEQRGMHRSWYVDEKDWLKSREIVDADQVAAAEQESASKAAKAAEEARPTYITAPNAGSGINNVCPICQERFENKWLDEAQEWVWLDAVLVKGRAYHWSCHKEATRDREGTPGPTEGTVLGKRKAETGLASPKVRSLKSYA